MPKAVNTETAVMPQRVDYGALSETQAVILRQFRERNPVHAYLLSGMKGIGKRTFARVLAMHLFCEQREDGQPCMYCAECQRVLDGTHPQLLTLFSDNGKTIGVDQVREVLTRLSRHSLENRWRAVLIEPMEKLTPAAQNALLKSLEEPESDVVYLLMTHELTATLGTIASRCVRVQMVPWPDGVLRQTLLQMQWSEDQIRRALPRSGGNIGTALQLMRQAQQQSEMLQTVQNVMSATADSQIVAVSTRMKDNKDTADEFLALLEQQLDQVLMAACGQIDLSLLDDFPPVWRQAAREKKVREINALLRAVFEARRRKDAAVNWQAALDQLLVQLLEAQQAWQK